MPRIGHRPQKKSEQFASVDDFKVRMTLVALADKYDELAKNIILKTYENRDILSKYESIRSSGMYQKGGKVHRKIVEFPNAYVFDFVDTVMKSLYGDDWLNNRLAMNHELVRPWWVVYKI